VGSDKVLEIVLMVVESPGKVLEFFVIKIWEPCLKVQQVGIAAQPMALFLLNLIWNVHHSDEVDFLC